MSFSNETLTKPQYEALSEFRYQLRRFFNFSEAVVKSAGITPLQYLLLLHIRGFPGRDWASVGELAERLQIQHHAAVALISRAEQQQLVQRVRSLHDKRQVEVRLLTKGQQILQHLAALHERELKSLQTTFQVSHISELNQATAANG